MNLVGLDLAWSPGRPSGVAVVAWRPGTSVLHTLEGQQVPDHAALVALLRSLRPPEHFGLLVDAPLQGSGPFRRAEREAARLLRRYRVGFLPFRNLDFTVLLEALRGYRLYPPEVRSLCRTGGWVVETYPQAVAVGLLGRRLPYKYGPRPRRDAAWHRFLQAVQQRLRKNGLVVDPSVPQGFSSTHVRDAWVAALGGAVACALEAHRRFPEAPEPSEPYLWIPWLHDPTKPPKTEQSLP